MFKITNEQLIQIAAVDSGLDPFAEYCTKGMWENAGYKIQKGEKPVLVLELWCPRERKSSAGGSLSSAGKIPGLDSSVSGENSGALAGMFFQFKKCNLYTRTQVISAEELAQEKEAKKIRKQMEKQFKAAVMAQGGIKPSQDYESLPQWCRRKNGAAIDEAVAEVAAAGYPVQDADGLFGMLQAI
jgi:hypothetical protein